MKRYRIFGSKFNKHLRPIALKANKTFVIRVHIVGSDTIVFRQRVTVQILKYADANTFVLSVEPKTLFETAPIFAHYGEPLTFEFNAN